MRIDKCRIGQGLILLPFVSIGLVSFGALLWADWQAALFLLGLIVFGFVPVIVGVMLCE
jgi:hypothetical protein